MGEILVMLGGVAVGVGVLLIMNRPKGNKIRMNKENRNDEEISG